MKSPAAITHDCRFPAEGKRSLFGSRRGSFRIRDGHFGFEIGRAFARMEFMMKKLFAPGNDSKATSLGLLALRVLLGLAMLLNHGIDKLSHFNAYASKFPDPLHIGAMPGLGLVTFAETAGAALLVFGLFTRFAAVTLVTDMAVAVFMVHKAANGEGELAFVYLAGFATLLIAGAGKFSLDNVLFGKGGRRPESGH
jgi:putative oxidoreductase